MREWSGRGLIRDGDPRRGRERSAARARSSLRYGEGSLDRWRASAPLRLGRRGSALRDRARHGRAALCSTASGRQAGSSPPTRPAAARAMSLRNTRELRAGVPFKAVTNPVAAQGGALSEAPRRWPRGGAAVADTPIAGSPRAILEWIARGASPAVARAHCLPVTGPIGRVQRGWVTVLVVPHGTEPQPIPTPELRRRVRAHLAARVPAAAAGRCASLRRFYVAVGVVANVVPERPDDTARVVKRACSRDWRSFSIRSRAGRTGAAGDSANCSTSRRSRCCSKARRCRLRGWRS